VTDELIAQLFDFGALGLFAGFLIYLYLGMQKRMDTLVSAFQGQLRDIQARCDEQEEKLRDRYDKVISKTEEDKDALRDSMLRAIEDNARKLDSALSKLDTGLTEMQAHYRDSRQPWDGVERRRNRDS
tara:strand:+ start:2830 stop:3213 length:384 start_codon:yes stop_codon:yes gene_type:complete